MDTNVKFLISGLTKEIPGKSKESILITESNFTETFLKLEKVTRKFLFGMKVKLYTPDPMTTLYPDTVPLTPLI